MLFICLNSFFKKIFVILYKMTNKFDEINKLILLKNYKENINNHLNKKISEKTLKKLLVYFQDYIGTDIHNYINFNNSRQIERLSEDLYKISYIVSYLINDINNNTLNLKEVKNMARKLDIELSDDDVKKLVNLLNSKKQHLPQLCYKYYEDKLNFSSYEQSGGKMCIDSGKSYIILNILDLIATVVGLVPGVGIFADIGSIFLSAATCDYLGAGISLINAIPAVGMFSGIIKAGKKLLNIYEGYQMIKNPETFIKKKIMPKGLRKWSNRKQQLEEGIELTQALNQPQQYQPIVTRQQYQPIVTRQQYQPIVTRQ